MRGGVRHVWQVFLTSFKELLHDIHVGHASASSEEQTQKHKVHLLKDTVCLNLIQASKNGGANNSA